MEYIINILSSGAVAAATSGTLIFLFKNWISERIKNSIEFEYNQKLETHKAQLQSQNEIEITKLKADLEVAAAERNFRYSRVFEKTEETIATAYEKLMEIKNTANDFMMLSADDGEKHEEMIRLMTQQRSDFQTYFERRLIYLPKDTATKIMIFATKSVLVTLNYARILKMERAKISPEVIEERREKFEKSIEEVDEILRLLRDDLQRVLGF